MRQEECFYLGKVVSKHSYKGEVLIKLDTDQPELYDTLESVFLEMDHGLVPFFIERIRRHKSELLRVKFENTSDEAEAQSLIGKKAFLPLTMLPELTGEQFYFHEIIGFYVEDRIRGAIGIVRRVNEHAAQAVLEVEKDESTILIPITDAIIEKVDRSKKTIYVDSPEGLIDLYLG